MGPRSLLVILFASYFVAQPYYVRAQPVDVPSEEAPAGEPTSEPTSEPSGGTPMAFEDMAVAVVNDARDRGIVKPEVKRFFDEVPGFEQLVAEATSRALVAEGLAPTALANIRSFIEQAYAESAEQRERLLQLTAVVEKAQTLSDAGDFEGLKALESSVTNSTQKVVVRRHLALVTPAIDEPPAAAPPAGSPYERLKEIARGQGGPPKERLVLFSQLLTEISDGLADGKLQREGWPFDDPAVRKSLNSLVGTNPTMQQRLVELYEDHIMHLVRQDDGEKLRAFYFAVLELRPDPNELNNKLRLRIAFKATGENARHFAIGRLDELKQARGISLLDRFRLVLKGYYGTAQPIVVLTIVCLCAFAAFLKLFRWSGAVKDTHDKYKRAKAYEDENQRQTEDFVREKQRASRSSAPQSQKRYREPQEEKFDDRRGPGYYRPVDSEDEYSRLLAFFDLDDEATEADIKAAYRDMVKMHHPDRNPDGEKDQIEAFFQEIKEKYDRIMEMRGSWFGKGR